MSFFKPEHATEFFGYYLKWLDLTPLSIDFKDKVLSAEVLEIPDDEFFSLTFEANDGNYIVELAIVDIFNNDITHGFFTGYKKLWCIESKDLKRKSLFQFYVDTQEEAREFMSLNFSYYPVF